MVNPTSAASQETPRRRQTRPSTFPIIPITSSHSPHTYQPRPPQALTRDLQEQSHGGTAKHRLVAPHSTVPARKRPHWPTLDAGRRARLQPLGPVGSPTSRILRESETRSQQYVTSTTHERCSHQPGSEAYRIATAQMPRPAQTRQARRGGVG